MTVSDVRAAFLSLPPDRKSKVVSVLAHNLTLAARGAYPQLVDEGVAAKKLQAFNEIQHTVTAKLMDIVAGTALGFPDEGFLDVLFEKAQQADCERDLVQAFEWSWGAKW